MTFSFPSALSPLRPPSAQDRAQLINAVSQQVAWQQQSALHVRQQAQLKHPPPVSMGVGARRQAASRLRQPPQIVTLQYQVWSLQQGQQAVQKLTAPGEIVKLFQSDGVGGRLLILGEPGAGKTQTLLLLAADLLKQARISTAVVPVLLDLSSWQGEAWPNWVMAKLWEQYRVPENCARAWLETARLALLLDGFDHLPGSQQRTCAAAIETWMRSDINQTVALCCRRQVLERSGISFSQFNGGIHLLPLVAQQVKDYAVGLGQPELWKGIKASKVLQQLARQPFLLNCMAEFTIDQPAIDQHDLVQRYIAHQLSSAGSKAPFPVHRSQRYLAWLASYLEGRDRIFYLESLTPAALPSSQRWVYRLLLGGTLGLITGYFGQPIYGLAVGLFTSQFDLEAFPKYRLAVAALSWRSGLALVARSLLPGLLLGALAGLVAARFAAGGIGFALGTLVGLAGGLLVSGLLELRTGLQGSIGVRQQPNQDTFNSVRNLFIGVIAVALLLRAGFALAGFSSAAGTPSPLSPSLLKGAAATAVAFGLWASYGLQHSLIRLLLSAGGAMPLNYARFLDYAARQKLLQKIGGGYSFVSEQVRQAAQAFRE